MRLLSLALVLFFVPQDEKITLKFNPKPGDKLTQTTKMEMKLKITIDAGGGSQDVEVEQRGTEKTATEIVEVTAGKLTKVVKDFIEDYEEEKAPGMEEWKRKDNPLHGRKVTLSMKDGKLVREGAEGLKEKELNKLDLEDKDSRLLPKEPVRVGEGWEVKGEDVRKYLGDDDITDGKMKLKVVAIKEIDKRRCAMIQGTFDLVGKVEGNVDLSLKLDAEMIVWIDRGYTLSVKGKGKVTVKGDGGGAPMTGEGPITIELSTKVE